MARKRSMTDVRDYIQWVIDTCEFAQKYPNAPLLHDEFPKLKLIGRAILNKHEAKHTRKDIYISQAKGE